MANREGQCNHQFKVVEGHKGKEGEVMVLCHKCGESKLTTPKPITESKDKKPLLLG